MDLLTIALVAALGALLGAWAGARAAFDRYRSERSFDRQVDWYERAARGLGNCVDVLQAARFLEDEGRREEAAEWFSRMGRCLMRLGLIATESDLYAGQNGHTTLTNTVHELNRIDRLSKVEARTDQIAARTAMADRMLPVLRNCRFVLANELRGHLKLAPIQELIGPGSD
jgi:hypothetical protein